MSESLRKLIIVGSGPAGFTAGIYAARANLSPLIIEGESPGGQLMGTSSVENWPGEQSIMGPKLMQNMREHAKHAGSDFLSESVVRTDFSRSPFTLYTNKDKKLQAHSIIIATGATPKKLKVPGEDIYWGKGITTCAVCDGAFYKNMPVVVVGGGDTAMEEASFMTKFTDDITIIHILDKLTATATMQQRVLNNPKINVIYSSTVTEIKGDGEKVQEVTITHQKTKKTQTLSTGAVFIAIGLNPNTEPFKDQLSVNQYGYLQLNNVTHTSVQGVFGAGDVADARYRQAVTSAGAGCMAAMDAERYLANQKLL